MQRPRICERFESAAFKAVRPDPQELKYLSVPLRIRQLGRRISRPLVSTSTGKFGSSELTLSYCFKRGRSIRFSKIQKTTQNLHIIIWRILLI